MKNNDSLSKIVFLFCVILHSIFALETKAQSVVKPTTPILGNSQWQFAVSGDSRNCGDVVMPTIAQDVSHTNSQFYWHLGDLRAISNFDEDIVQRPGIKPLSISQYETEAWQDFIENQINPFTIPFYVGIGNHETILPKTRAEFIAQFADWLNAPAIKEQRLRDDADDHRLKTYYHWIQNGVDFIYLDNATTDQFDAEQLGWFNKIIDKSEANPNITTIVVGMHEALPDSLVMDDSMSHYPTGVESGRIVYKRLLQAKSRGHKSVYVLASHSHFFMDGIFNTEYWKAHGGVLPGWIVGTGGAVRNRLPEDANLARAAKTNVYGYLLATVNPDDKPAGSIRFDFRELQETSVSPAMVKRFGTDLVHQCFEKNTKAR